MSERDDVIGRLLRETGRRPQAAPERSTRVDAFVRARWRASVAARRRRGWLRFAAAAVIVALLAGLAWRFRPRPGETDVATIERGRDAGGALVQGTTVATGVTERVALRTRSGHSIRLDTSSRVRLLSARVVALDAGAVYVDSGPIVPPGAPLEVRTPFGVLHDVGTQFEARLLGSTVEIRVREGAVAFDTGAARGRVEPGRTTALDAQGARPLPPEPPFGPRWAWVEDAAPRIAIEGRDLAAVLGWAAREKGLALRYASPEVAETAARTVLRGSIEGMTIDEALASVLATSGLGRAPVSAELLVERR